MLGRVLRQPGPSRTGVDSLDRCYVYCHHTDTGIVADHVRKGLADMGMGDAAHTIMPANQGESVRTVRKRKTGQRGRVFLPLVLHRQGGGWRELEYESDILSGVDFGAVDAPDPVNFSAKRHGWNRRTITFDGEAETEWKAHDAKSAGVSDLALSLSDVVPNVWQAARIVLDFMGRLRDSGRTESDMYDGLPYLRKALRDHVAESVNRQAEAIFRGKVECGDIRFDLEIEGRNYKIRDYDVEQGTLLQSREGGSVQRTLFDPVYVGEFDSDLELNFAKYLDGRGIVKWWHRLAAVQGGYRLAGWERRRYYPDFIVMTNEAGDRARLGIYDTKGGNLVGNRDTTYKERLLETLEGAFDCGMARVRDGCMRGEFRLVFADRFDEILADDIEEETVDAS